MAKQIMVDGKKNIMLGFGPKVSTNTILHKAR